ncbi:hypothetical protein ACGFR8_11840 [Streptomyces brevispora]|uniref:hypothetical protein n=1 Tax=Streptomyces brevispora TaxID=887462 RepID=UPI003715A51E
MFHRIRTRLSRVLRARPVVQPQPQSPYVRHVFRLAPRTRPVVIDPERRLRRTVMRLALDGLVVAAGTGQAYSAGALVVATTRVAA